MPLVLPGGPGTAEAMLCWASPGASVARSALTSWGLSPNPPCSKRASAGAPLLWALTHWGSGGVQALGVPRWKVPGETLFGSEPCPASPSSPQ